jgi:hypothetical protein
METSFFTLQDFYTFTKGVAYLLVVVTLFGLAGYWLYLNGRDEDDRE